MLLYLYAMQTTSSGTNQLATVDRDTQVFPFDVSVIIVNYNVCRYLEQALDSVFRAAAGLKVEVFVVDNDSVDGSVEMVRERFPQVHLIENERNLGFSKANNLAIAEANGRYLFILNPDTIVQEDTFQALIRFMDEHPEAGAAGCRILNPDGTFARESRRSFPSPAVAFAKIAGLSRLFPKSRLFGRYNLTFLPDDQVSEVDALSGSCMFVRHAAVHLSSAQFASLKANHDMLRADVRQAAFTLVTDTGSGSGAGMFDEDFFMYGEDLDWCFRIGRAGWKIYYTPATQIIHFKGESTKRGELRYVRLFYGAMSHFVDKHFHTHYSRLFSVLLHLGIWMRAAQSVLYQWLSHARIPFMEWLVAFAAISGVALVRSVPSTFSFPPVFFLVVVPIYALSIVFCIGLVGGYRRRRRSRSRPAWQGTGIAFLAVATGSFFFKSVAYSRVVLLFGFLTALIALLVIRWIRREFGERRIGQRQAIVVGPASAAEQFRSLLRSHPQPSLEVVGYVEIEEASGAARSKFTTIPKLGRADQLRDIIRLRHIDDLVFAAGHVPNERMFGMMRGLIDLPIQFKILQQEQHQVIGKSFSRQVADVSPLVDAELELAIPRGRFERRVSESTIVLAAVVAFVILMIPGVIMAPRAGWLRRLRKVAGSVVAVVPGKTALVGYDPEGAFIPPDEWGIPEGRVHVQALHPGSGLSYELLQQVYWRYAQEQSFLVDLQIVVGFIRRDREQGLSA